MQPFLQTEENLSDWFLLFSTRVALQKLELVTLRCDLSGYLYEYMCNVCTVYGIENLR